MEQSSFHAHPMWASLMSLEAALEAVDVQTHPHAGTKVDNLRYVVSIAKSHRDPSDTGPYSSLALTKIDSHLPNVTQEVQSFSANGNIAHLANAEQHADQVLYYVGLLPSSILKGGAAAQANKVFTEYRDSAEDSLAKLRQTNAELTEKLETQGAAADAELASLKAEIASLTATISQDETRLSTALTTNNDAFIAKQTEREEKFTSWLDQQAGALAHLAANDLAAAKSSREMAAAAFAEIDGLRDDTKIVAGLAAGDQVARGYKGYSFRQWCAGLIAYALGFGALTLGAYAVIKTFKDIAPDDEISWQYATLKLGLTVSALAAAVVAFRLGSHLLAQAATSKRFELELKAIGPLFSKDSEQATLESVKKDLVERSFGHGWGSGVQSRDMFDQKFIEKVADAVARVTSRSGP